MSRCRCTAQAARMRSGERDPSARPGVPLLRNARPEHLLRPVRGRPHPLLRRRGVWRYLPSATQRAGGILRHAASTPPIY